jgi:ech hydrogenase subunit D
VGVELLYSFSDGLELENLSLVVNTDTAVPSITQLFPAAFFFENEVHDLFGVTFTGISIDFDGAFYTLSIPTPMNPVGNGSKSFQNDPNPAQPTANTNTKEEN